MKPFAAIMRHRLSKEDYFIVLEYFDSDLDVMSFIWLLRDKDPDFNYELAMWM